MEWILNNWLILVLVGLVAGMYFFNRKPGSRHAGDPHTQAEGTHDTDQHHRGGGHGCCH